MTDSSGRVIQSALPGMAVTVSGWKLLPKAGDEVLDGTEGDIKKAIANRLRREEAEALQEDAEVINESRRQEREARTEGEDAPAAPVANDGPKELRLLIKGDVSGSCEALEGALNSIGNNIAISKVIHTGVGDITESDILMAKAANGEFRLLLALRLVNSRARDDNWLLSFGSSIDFVTGGSKRGSGLYGEHYLSPH
jgi:translation initiation factor IF-2